MLPQFVHGSLPVGAIITIVCALFIPFAKGSQPPLWPLLVFGFILLWMLSILIQVLVMGIKAPISRGILFYYEIVITIPCAVSALCLQGGGYCPLAWSYAAFLVLYAALLPLGLKLSGRIAAAPSARDDET